MSERIARLAEMIEEIIIEAEDEPHFTTREHATTGAEEICRDLIMPALAEAWDEGKRAGLRQSDWEHGDTATRYVAHNPYRQEQDA